MPTVPHAESLPVILWLHRELRLRDNPAVQAAVASGRPVLPVFVLDDETPGTWAAGGASRWWLHHSLTSLAADFAARGAGLVLRRGRFADIIPRLVAETRAVAVHAGQPGEPWARAAMAEVAKALGERLHLHRTTTLFEPDSIRTKTGGAYGVFTPYSRACLARGAPPKPVPAPARIAGVQAASDDLADWTLLPGRPDWAGGLRATWVPGEHGAAQRLARFVREVVTGYDRTRNLPAIAGTSSLSPHLHWGEISAGEVWHAAAAAGESAGASAYLLELLWREFSADLLWHNPDLPEQPLRREYAAMPWRRDPAALEAWRRGRTGLPIVDAGMRQLWHTGWMHNRVRMIAASFLVKHLLIPWQDGEAWFWDTLVDADLASNAAQWQWVAGCGADAAPFFRIFNPVLQGRKFDPDGAYVRQWVPELAGVPARYIHAPWEQPAEQQGDLLGRGGAAYPRPIVDLAAGRARALDAFRSLAAAA
jgi:deoxyribodipyrimidine photo-lyase